MPDPINLTTYLDEERQWYELAAHLRNAGEFGLDTEFTGVDLAGQSPVGRARVHVWSVATRTPRMDPRGFHRCDGWVLPGRALDHGELRRVLEDPRIVKAVHNQSVDSHALANHGIALRGGVNTLGLIRWMRPGLINTAGRFALKSLMQSLLGRVPVCTFKELVSFDRMVPESKWKKVTTKHCMCGEDGCRRRKAEEFRLATMVYVQSHDKYEVTEDVEVIGERRERGEYPLESILPGHERWDQLIEYALDDAVAALQVMELAYDTADPGAWPYGGTRPTFNQALEECIIEMESVGIPVDLAWCRATAENAEIDEERELWWLYRWYVANAPTHGPWQQEHADAIWTSPKRMIELFDALGWPRSPVWGKGRVKPGDVKLDATALNWIARAEEDAAQFIGHLLNLKKIRSSKKYLVKLRDSSGLIHPICGPAGDDDDRAGAVTGRLGIKGELEAQQLPAREEKDPYQVRRAIIA